MKTSTVEVGELVSTLSAAGVFRQLTTLPGVHHADVNYVAGSATVHYDEAMITLDAIRQRVLDCGYHCRGELVPAHVCDSADHKAGGEAHTGYAEHAGHAMPAGTTEKKYGRCAGSSVDGDAGAFAAAATLVVKHPWQSRRFIRSVGLPLPLRCPVRTRP